MRVIAARALAPRPRPRPEHVCRGAALIVAMLVVLAVKHHYSHATAGELRWILAPTAWLVSAATGAGFAFEAGTGWISHELSYILAPSCAGVNFALAAFLALSLGWWAGMRRPCATAARLAAAAALAYLAAVVVNAGRIWLAIALHRGWIDTGGVDPATVHRAEGIAVYLGGLVALVALARALERSGGRDAAHA